MAAAGSISFPPFQLDLKDECLKRGPDRIVLKPKVFAVLRCLVEQAGCLVTKEELFRSVWGQTRVGDAVLRGYIRELRRALQDPAQAPRFIETVHGRGFRFVADIQNDHYHNQAPVHQSLDAQASAPVAPALVPVLVGREAELADLHSCFNTARNGKRQVVFVTGEAGIGKTSLVNVFRAELSRQGLPWVEHGHCIEQYGVGEAFLPVFAALGRLCRGQRGQQCLRLLKQSAPTWLVQMPAVVSPAELSTLQRQMRSSSRERMFREFAEALERLSLESPLVLIFEDVHWSDYSTLDLLAFVARRPEAARLLIVATYRPEDIPSPGHPLLAVKHELQIHGLCAELPLPFLSEAAVAGYLERQFSGVAPAAELVRVLHRMSEGNPLFLVNIFRDLLERQMIEQVDGVLTLVDGDDALGPRVPHSLQQLISWQIGRLSRDAQQVLEAASVAGTEFSSAAVAAGVGQNLVWCEEVCESLVRSGRFLRRGGTSDWPDGTRHTRYDFVHALYQEVLYQQLSGGKLAHLHRQIGERTQQGYGAQAGTIAGELARHFERGRDFPRAIEYRQQAAQNAVLRYAYREAEEHCTSGLALLDQITDPTLRSRLELALRCCQLGPLVALKGEAGVEVEQVCDRALTLCQQLGDFSPRRLVQFLLWSGRLSGGKVFEARDLAGQILVEAYRTQEADAADAADALVWAHFVNGLTESCAGALSSARAHLAQLIRLHDPEQQYSALMDPKTGGLSHLAALLWLQGYPEQARQTAQDVVSWAQQRDQPYGIAFAGLGMARLRHLAGDFGPAHEQMQAVIALTTEHGFAQIGALASMFQGQTQAALGHPQEGMRQIQAGLSAYQKTGARLFRPLILAMLAEVYTQIGQVDEGLRCIAEALAEAHAKGERQFEAEFYRLKGEILLNDERRVQNDERQKRTTETSSVHRSSFIIHRFEEAEECFHTALEIAQYQQAKSLELRAAMSLSRLLAAQKQRQAAYTLLSGVYEWFTEGFETADLQAAQVLLARLS